MSYGYLIAVFSVIFVALICSFIVPEGKLKKSINFVLRIICIGVLIKPVVGLFKLNSSSSQAVYDYDYICKIYSENQSNLLTQKINDKFNTDLICIVKIIYTDEKITEDGVTVNGNFKEGVTIDAITEYLRELCYINITENEKSD